jgi:hypothetical protein
LYSLPAATKRLKQIKGGALIQRIDAAGRTAWADNGVLVFLDGDCFTHVLSDDGCGGAIVAWGSGKSLIKPKKSYVQRIDGEGNCLWGDKGISLNP